MKKWTKSEEEVMRKLYPEKGKMWCANKLGRKEGSIRQKACKMGLFQNKNSDFFRDWQKRAAIGHVGKKRPEQALVMKRNHAEGKFTFPPERRERMSVISKAWHRNNPHPRAALGMKHTAEFKAKMSERVKKYWANVTEEDLVIRNIRACKTRLKNGTLYNNNRAKASWKGGWREIGGIKKFYRSRWEANYARYLEFLKEKSEIIKWEHEPETFWFEGVKRGTVTYLPDFRVTNNDSTIEYHEVKGWMDAKSKTKIKRMGKYYPDVKLVVIQKKEYYEIRDKVSRLIPGWEQ